MRKHDKNFGERLRETRVQAGLSQSELEERSGIPKARLSRYENGHVVPSIHTLERLALALGVSEASLLGDERAVLEEFFKTLVVRGVRIHSSEQGVKLANAVADLLDAAGALEPGARRSDPQMAVAAPSVASVRRWLESGDAPATGDL